MKKIILVTFISIIMAVLSIYLPISLYGVNDGSSSNWSNLIEVNDTMLKEEERLENLSMDERKRTIDILKSQMEMQTLQGFIGLYSLDHNKNPERLDDLLTEKYLKNKENILDSWGNLYEFEIIGNTQRHINEIRILSYGPDGEKNTDDDIVSSNILNCEKYDLDAVEKNIKNIAPFGITITSVKKDNNLLKVFGVIWAPVLRAYSPQTEMYNSLYELERILEAHFINSDTYIDGHRFLTICAMETQPLREFSLKAKQLDSGKIIKVDDIMLKEEELYHSLPDNELIEKKKTIGIYKKINMVKILLLNYADDYKRYPDYLEELVANNYVHSSSVTDPWGNLYLLNIIYDNNMIPQKITITSTGHDQNEGTEDDIIFSYKILPEVIDLATLEKEIRVISPYGLKITSVERKDNILNVYGYSWDNSLITDLMRELISHSINCNAYIKLDKFKLICSSEELPTPEKGIVDGGYWVPGKNLKEDMLINKLKKREPIDKETVIAEINKILPEKLKEAAQIKVGTKSASVLIIIPDENDSLNLCLNLTSKFEPTTYLQGASIIYFKRDSKIGQRQMLEMKAGYAYPKDVVLSNVTLSTKAISNSKISTDIKSILSSDFFRYHIATTEDYICIYIVSRNPDVSLEKLKEVIGIIKSLDYIKDIKLIYDDIEFTKDNKLDARLYCFLDDKYFIMKIKDSVNEYKPKQEVFHEEDSLQEVPNSEISENKAPEKIAIKQIEINSENNLITANIKNIDIHEFFVELGERVKQSIFIDGNIEGEVNIDVKEYTFEDILKELQKANSFIYEVKNNIVFISKNGLPFPYEEKTWRLGKGKYKTINALWEKIPITSLETIIGEALGAPVFKYDSLLKLKFSCYINNIPFEHSLYCILRICGLQYETEDNIINIWPYGEEKPKINKQDLRLPYEGFKSPDFTIKTIDGATITLSGQEGKIVLLYFWVPGELCYAGIEILNEIYNKYPKEKIQIIGIFSSEKTKYLEEHKTGWPQYVGENPYRNKLKELYKVGSFPFMILIDKTGVIKYRNSEIKNLDQLVDNVINQQ